MNCDAVQRRLLAAERPGRPHADARRHLAACPACRAWARRLVEAEQQIPLVPVPPTTALDDLLRQILEPAPVGADGLPPLVRPRPRPPMPARERGLYKLSWAVAIAATLLVGVIGGLLLVHRPAPPPAPKPVPQLVRDWQDRRGQALAAAQTPRERVEKLASLATDLKDQAALLADEGDADRMADLAVACRELVEELVSRADEVQAADRPAVLAAAAARLRQVESDFSKMAAKPGAAPALHDLAFAADDGSKRLRALILREAS